MLSKNEWDPLKKVVVGTANGARIPTMDASLRTINYADREHVRDVNVGLYPQKVIQEANEDLEQLVTALKAEGIEVIRPSARFTPDYYHYCPRDTFLVHDNLVLATPQPLRARKNEYLALDHFFDNYTRQTKSRYIVANKNFEEALYNKACIGNSDILALSEIAPAFDAANCLRANDDIFYLVSNTGNMQGLHYLQELVGNKVKVWPITGVYSYAHIDSTIAFLREGLMLVNPDRIKSVDQLPEPLKKWDIIYSPEPVDQGFHPGYAMASKWVYTLNLLSINPKLVIIENHQEQLARILKGYNIETHRLPGRQHRTLSGGFHCVTLDLERNHR